MEYKYEIPWCHTCRDWHFPGPHTRNVSSTSWNANWGYASSTPPPAKVGDAMLDAALRVLGVPASASVREARKAFRARIMRAHPDHGGSSEETKRLLAARDVLRARRRM